MDRKKEKKDTRSIVVLMALATALIVGPLAYALPQAMGTSDPAVVAEALKPWLASAFAVACVAAFHGYALKVVFGDFLAGDVNWRRTTLSVVIMTLAHAAEIQIFAMIMFLFVLTTVEPGLDGESAGRFIDYIYFSYTTYTSLGVGDIFPVQGLRLMAGLESLVGLLMIGWTASMYVVASRRAWLSS